MNFDSNNLNLSQWFQEQLRTSGYGFVWAVNQVPAERQKLTPPQQLGEWSAARHVFHLLYHEENNAIPRIKQWLGGESPIIDKTAEQLVWENSQDTIEIMLKHFLELRQEQIMLASQFSNREVWLSKKEVQGWGYVDLNWVFSKNYQHTTEHIHDILQIALFWERMQKQSDDV
jgi:hypothetical protein